MCKNTAKWWLWLTLAPVQEQNISNKNRNQSWYRYFDIGSKSREQCWNNSAFMHSYAWRKNTLISQFWPERTEALSRSQPLKDIVTGAVHVLVWMTVFALVWQHLEYILCNPGSVLLVFFWLNQSLYAEHIHKINVQIFQLLHALPS